MKIERRKFGKVLIFAVFFAMFVFVSVGCASATTIYVGPGDSIQDAVDGANPDDMIIVRDGTYTENVDVTVDNLTIRSENGSATCIVQAADPNDHVFEVTADYVNISGFTVKGANGGGKAGLYLSKAHYCNISSNVASNNWYGISLSYSSNNIIENNNANSNKFHGIHLTQSSNNIIKSNNMNSNSQYGNHLWFSSNNIIENNNANSNVFCGIYLSHSSSNVIKNNNIDLNNWGIFSSSSNNNIIRNNNINSNKEYGIYLWMYSSNNGFYLNNFINNAANVYSYESVNIWNSSSKMTYSYKGNTYTNYTGNYWDNYEGIDTNNDGIGDASYSINSEKDNYPLMEPWENYFVETENIKIVSFDTDKEVYDANEEINFFLSIYAPKNISDALIKVTGVKSTKGVYFVSYSNLTDLVIGLNNISFIKKLPSCIKCAGLGAGTYFINASVTYDAEVVTATHSIVLIKYIFDTGSPATPYPSIAGTHNGTITPSCNISVSKLYTYPCAGTGGHTKYAKIWNSSWTGAEAHWNGYIGDWHNISFNETFILVVNETYNYTIRTGSYPQIHHNRTLLTENGWINCTEFTDANGKKHATWIPAIKLY